MSLTVGQKATARRVFTADDLAQYLSLTGDTNPLYADPKAPARANLAGPPIPGMLLGGMISCLLGVELPGRGTNWMKQRYDLVGMAYVGDTVEATVEVIRLRPDKNLVNLRTTLTANGRLVVEGEALVMAREMENSQNRAQ